LSITVRRADLVDSERVAGVAAATFALACPPSITPERIAAFIDEVLSPERFAEYVTAPGRLVLLAELAGSAIGYAMLVAEQPQDEDVQAAIRDHPTVELSKIYVLPDAHGGAVSGMLLAEGLQWARDRGAAGVWLGVNQQNARAQRFYAKSGFTVVGTKRFRVGDRYEDDFIMERALGTQGPDPAPR
jgi:ribosomal protein S18 acetylase RimI-like enzyme